MARQDFDYGEQPVKAEGIFKQPEVGETTGRVKSIIHLGTFAQTFQRKKKPPAPFVAVVFELHGQFEDDEETPLTTSISFPLKTGKKSSMTKFLDAVDPKEETSGFHECIGLPVSLKMEGKEKQDDGTYKYVNCAGVSAVANSILKLSPEVLAGVLPPLKEEGVGFVKYNELTKEAIMELNPYLHVALIMEKAENFKGSKAEELLKEIRKEHPDFGKIDKKKEDEDDNESMPEERQPPPELDENVEY